MLTDEELERLKPVLDDLEVDAKFGIGAQFISGGFANATMYDYDKDIIDVELKFGIQSDCQNTVHTENIKIDRLTMEVMN